MLQRIDTREMPDHIRLVHSAADPATQDPVTAIRLKAWAIRQKAAREQAEAEDARFSRWALWAAISVFVGTTVGVIAIAFIYRA